MLAVSLIKREQSNNADNECNFLKLEINGEIHYCKKIRPQKLSLLQEYKNKLLIHLRKLKIIKMEEYYAELNFVENDDDSKVCFLVPMIIRAEHVKDAMRQHQNLHIEFAQKGFLLSHLVKLVKITDYNIDLYKMKLDSFKNGYNVKYINFTEWKVRDFKEKPNLTVTDWQTHICKYGENVDLVRKLEKKLLPIRVYNSKDVTQLDHLTLEFIYSN